MKRLSEKQKLRNINQSESAKKRKVRNNFRKRQKRAGIGNYQRTTLSAPEEFNFQNGLRRTLHFFNKLRETILSENKIGIIHFDTCRSISASAGLVLAAEIDRCKTYRFRDGKSTLSGTYPRDHGMRDFLDQLGFYKLLKIRKPQIASKNSTSTKFITMQSGIRDIGKRIHYVTEVLQTGAIRLDDKTQEELYVGLLEAMNNATSHAYPSEDQTNIKFPVITGKWWAAGYWDTKEREIGVMLYDQGVGIPATLSSGDHLPLVKDILERLGLKNNDENYIKAAMDIGKTRLKTNHRGKGMACLRRVVENVSSGHLSILSGRGRYILEVGGTEKISPLPMSMGGTLVEWRISDNNMVT